jgi:hypothetical protein
MRPAGIAAVAATAALLIAATPAAADSVAYVKGGDVWLSTPDGSRQYRVTSDGGYSTVSQADSGRLVALRGTRIRHLERDGRVIADIATPASNDDPALSFRGPFEPEVSPNGKRVSYTYYWQYKGYDPYCNPSNGCYVKRLYHGTAFTDPNRLTAWDEPGFQRQSGWIYGSWIDNDRVLLSHPSVQPNEDVVIASPNSKDEFRRWFVDPLHHDKVSDATISRDKSAMATVTANGAEMSILRSEGLFHPAYPVRCFEVKEPAGSGGAAKFSSPTLNSTGTRLYWAEGDGVHAVSLPKFGAGDCGMVAAAPKLVVPGGANPSWGPAGVPPARPTTPPPPPKGPGGVAPPPSGGAPTPVVPVADGGRTVELGARLAAKKVSLRTALRRGIAVRVSGAREGRHVLAARLGRTRVARGTAAIGATGDGRATLRFTRAGRRRLAGRRSVKLLISGAGARVALTIKR